MSSPRFSVVIPTRERAACLRCCLRTCLKQDFDDYEVVVCDNHGGPATAELVREMADPRLRYLRAPEPLAMAANWELALSRAKGEYVLVLGDDDGLIPFALREIEALARRTGAKAVRWSPAVYTWPSVDLPGQGNYLCVPLSRQLRVADGRQTIRSVLQTLDYNALPMLYANAAIHRGLIEQMRAAAGRVFACRIPDVYTAFALGSLAGAFASVTVPLSVSGLSGKSNGVACLIRPEPNAISREFNALNAAGNFPPHPWVPDLPLFPVVPVAEGFYRAREVFFPGDAELDLPRRTVLEKCVTCLRGGAAARDRDFAVVRASAADDPELLAWFDGAFREPPPAASEAHLHQVRPTRLGCDGDNLHLDASAFGVENVEGAAELVARLLSLGSDEFRYDLRGRWDEMSECQDQLAASRRAADISRLRILEYQAAEAKRQRHPVRRIGRLVGRCVKRLASPLARSADSECEGG